MKRSSAKANGIPAFDLERADSFDKDRNLDTGAFEQGTDNFLGFKDIARHISRGARMLGVITVDRFHGIDNFAERAESKQAAIVSEGFREASVLNDHWPAGRQITNAAVAEPTGV